MKVVDEALQNEYLEKIDAAFDDLDEYDAKVHEHRKKLKGRAATLIHEAKIEADVSVKMVADHRDRSRQAINNVLIDHFGIRQPEKAKAAYLRHNREEIGEQATPYSEQGTK